MFSTCETCPISSRFVNTIVCCWTCKPLWTSTGKIALVQRENEINLSTAVNIDYDAVYFAHSWISPLRWTLCDVNSLVVSFSLTGIRGKESVSVKISTKKAWQRYLSGRFWTPHSFSNGYCANPASQFLDKRTYWGRICPIFLSKLLRKSWKL